MTFWWARAIEIGVRRRRRGASCRGWRCARSCRRSRRSARDASTNYRGRRVALGLGLVWVVWAIGVLLVAGPRSSRPRSLWWATGRIRRAGRRSRTSRRSMLVLGTALVGMADDVFGIGSEKGFRGHLAALRRGRLTTGAFKLLANRHARGSRDAPTCARLVRRARADCGRSADGCSARSRSR